MARIITTAMAGACFGVLATFHPDPLLQAAFTLACGWALVELGKAI